MSGSVRGDLAVLQEIIHRAFQGFGYLEKGAERRIDLPCLNLLEVSVIETKVAHVLLSQGLILPETLNIVSEALHAPF